MRPIARFSFILCAVLLLLACAKPRRPAPPPQVMPAPSFVCDMTGQEVMCSSERLARLDSEMVDALHAALRRTDSLGREHLNALQKAWLMGRAHACGVASLRSAAGEADAPSASLTNCLINLYSTRRDQLRRWPVAAPVAVPSAAPTAENAAPTPPHPLSAYVEFRPVLSADESRCRALADSFNTALRQQGGLNPARVPGLSVLAGSHSPLPNGAGYRVTLQDGGAYAGFALRARQLQNSSGQTLVDAATLGNWVRQLPNHGGRASSVATQTGDYASIDVLRSTQFPQQLLTLLVEPWGKYAPGAQGEWAYAGLYRLGVSQVEPLCLYRTYMTPPLKDELALLPGYSALLQTLNDISKPQLQLTQRELVGRELHEEYLLRQELHWQLQHMPLLALGEARLHGWWGWLRARHDQLHDALFAWSEYSLHNKRLWRRLLAQQAVAAAELSAFWQRTQRLTPADAEQAAELTLMRKLAEHASDLPGLAVVMHSDPRQPQFVRHVAQYPALAQEADILAERSYASLYSAALNGADAEVIADFLAYELGQANQTNQINPSSPSARDAFAQLSRGATGETALMAAVESPQLVQQLINAGMDVNASDQQGHTALMNAAQFGQIDSVRLLLAAGARDVAAACKMTGFAPPASRAQLAALLCQ